LLYIQYCIVSVFAVSGTRPITVAMRTGRHGSSTSPLHAALAFLQEISVSHRSHTSYCMVRAQVTRTFHVLFRKSVKKTTFFEVILFNKVQKGTNLGVRLGPENSEARALQTRAFCHTFRPRARKSLVRTQAEKGILDD